MGCSVSVKVVYGVKSDLEYFLEYETIPATCHPAKFKKGDKFCPECGEPTVIEKENLRVKPQYENFLPPFEGGDPCEWFEWGSWNGRPLQYLQRKWEKRSEVSGHRTVP